MRRYIIVALVLCVLVGVACAWPASMGSWDYRKSVTINNTGANLTNYQLMFTVNRSAGSDSNFTVFLDGKCAEDYDDIRFTTSDEETLCDYWIESSSSTVASIWVEAPSIVNSTAYGSTTLYLYYGNSGASAASNGTNTFDFFDDFLGSSVDTSKWTSTGSPSVSGGVVSIPAGSDLTGKTNFAANYALRTRLKYAGISDAIGPYFGFRNAGNGAFTWRTSPAGILCIYVYDGTEVRVGLNANPSTNTYYTFEVIRNGTTSASLTVPGYTTATATTHIPSDSVPIKVSTAGTTTTYDWVAVRKYTATAPTVSAWGSEEESPCVGSSVTATIGGVSPPSGEGYAPLMVSFTDSSIGTNCTIDSWNWSFGDGYYSNSQNPQHYFLSSGTYAITLIVGNTSCAKYDGSCEDLGDECLLYTIDENTDIPIADFTVTETCGETTDTFYFIDFSTGGGLYAWNWSFGDGSYSELRNPTHQYASEGTYDVNLSVWGAYGFDSLLRENLITIPCGAATPTPTPTVTPTGTPTATGPVPTAEVNETDVGETWIRWVWQDPGEPVDIYIDGAKVESWVNNTTQAYRLTGLNPSERHVLSLYRAGNATLIDQQDVTTLPATWLIVSVLAISIFFAVCTIISRDIYRVLLCSTIACVSSGFLAMIGVGHPWGITIIGIIVALITGVIAVIVALDLRNGDDDE